MSPRPMRVYHRPTLTCVVCGKPIRLAGVYPEPYVQDPRGVRHAINCLAPLARRKKVPT